MKKDGMDIKQIAEKLNVKREDIRAEMIKLVKSIKEKKTN
jgi:predicted ArsR family transcriptional regulator